MSNITPMQLYIGVGLIMVGVITIALLTEFVRNLLNLPQENSKRVAVLESRLDNFEKEIVEIKRSNEANFLEIKSMINKLLEKI